MTTKETKPASQRALAHASQLAGLDRSTALDCVSEFLRASIQAHAATLDLLWERCQDLAPKTKGELFADELKRRWEGSGVTWPVVAGQMIDENWEPKA